VPLLERENDSLPYCSGVLIDDFVIATAAHCVITGTNTLRREIWVGPAGVDLTTKPTLHRVNNIFLSKSYSRATNGSTQDQDMAFLTVKSPLLNGTKVRVASIAEAKALFGQALVVGGYGANRPYGQTVPTPSFVQQKVIDLVLNQYTIGTYVHIVASDTESPCPGDSGGPIFKENGDELVVIGTIAGSNGCQSMLATNERMVGFLISAFPDLKNSALNLVNQPANPPEGLKIQISDTRVTLSWNEQPETYLNATRGYVVKDSSGKSLCEAYTLAIFKNSTQCVFEMPETAISPFTLLPMGLKKNGTPIDLDLNQALNYYKIKAADAAAKAQADAAAKAQADAAAKAQADAAAKAQASSSSNKKILIKKITCVKGTIKKTITGTNPKCPTGYKIK
jgi:V8-like Glu-specific endopeptidase